MHLQQVNFNPERCVQNSMKLSNSLSSSLGQGSSAFDRFKGRTRLIYCVHMLDKEGVAAKHGALKEGDYLIEVRSLFKEVFLCVFLFECLSFCQLAETNTRYNPKLNICSKHKNDRIFF